MPLYNEEENLPVLMSELGAALAITGLTHELIFVDDGSTDGSAEVLAGLAKSLPQLRILRHQRNAGQSAALVAGFRVARGRLVVTLDSDLQNDPADIPRLLARLDEGFDAVSACAATGATAGSAGSRRASPTRCATGRPTSRSPTSAVRSRPTVANSSSTCRCSPACTASCRRWCAGTAPG
ncbi:MAG: glycosyltransferase family 2 protein [Thermoanaerobaculia bacterium]